MLLTKMTTTAVLDAKKIDIRNQELKKDVCSTIQSIKKIQLKPLT